MHRLQWNRCSLKTGVVAAQGDASLRKPQLWIFTIKAETKVTREYLQTAKRLVRKQMSHTDMAGVRKSDPRGQSISTPTTGGFSAGPCGLLSQG
jgi:hypothetical protein